MEFHIMEYKKEGDSNICYNVDEYWQHYAKWSKAVKYHANPLLWGTESSQNQRQKVEWWFPVGGRGVQWELLFSWYWVSVLQD